MLAHEDDATTLGLWLVASFSHFLMQTSASFASSPNGSSDSLGLIWDTAGSQELHPGTRCP